MASDPEALKRLDDLTAELWMEIVEMNLEHEELRDKGRELGHRMGVKVQRMRRMAGLDELAEPRIRRTVAS